MSFFEEMQRRISEVVLDGTIPVPSNEVDKEKGEEVVGQLSDRLKQHWVFVMRAFDNLAAEYESFRQVLWAIDNILPENRTPDQRELVARLALMDEELKLVEAAFWLDVRRQFAVATYGMDVDLREDWQVVAYPRCSCCGGNVPGIVFVLSACHGVQTQHQHPSVPPSDSHPVHGPTH